MKSGHLVIKPKRPKGDDGYKVFSIRIKEEIVAQIDDISLKTGRSRNELISIFLEYALGRCVVEEEHLRMSLERPDFYNFWPFLIYMKGDPYYK